MFNKRARTITLKKVADPTLPISFQFTTVQFNTFDSTAKYNKIRQIKC